MQIHPPVVERLRIAVRERPVPEEEVSHVQVALRTDEEKIVAFAPLAADGLMYDYDYYYPPATRQDDVFRTVGVEMVDAVMGGISANCVVLGATGTGKTHTLFGSEEQSGLLQDTVHELFARLENQAGSQDHQVRLRYWEMNRDGVLDNLADDNYEATNTMRSSAEGEPVRHSIFRDVFGRLYVAGLSDVPVASFAEFEAALDNGHRRRIQRGRQRHCRWHGFVQLSVSTTDKVRGETCVLRQMTFAHLKGTERASESGAKGKWLQESSNINVSLTLLCAGVIHSLEYRNKRAAAARRPEELHALIQKSESFFMECKFSQFMAQLLCGHEASFVIGCVDPLRYEETINTLENLQLLRHLTCACVPITTDSQKGQLLRKLRQLEHRYGGADVLENVYGDSSGRPLTEEEEALLRLRSRVSDCGVTGEAREQAAQRREEELRERGRARAARAVEENVRGASAATAGSRASCSVRAATHGDRGRIYLNPAKTATYEGQWADGVFDGFGEHIQPSFKYRGEFRSGQRDGEGTLFVRKSKTAPYQRVYQGEWLKGVRDGRGTQWEEDGTVYEGDFVADQRQGNGRLYLPNGDVVEGSFSNGLVEGWAVLRAATGDWFEGYWSRGLREGPGVWHYTTKKRSLKGEWSKNVSVMGVIEDDPDKDDDRCSGFIPRVALLNYEEMLVKQREKLNERREREFAAKGLKWVDHAAVAANAHTAANSDSRVAAELDVE